MPQVGSQLIPQLSVEYYPLGAVVGCPEITKQER